MLTKSFSTSLLSSHYPLGRYLEERVFPWHWPLWNSSDAIGHAGSALNGGRTSHLNSWNWKKSFEPVKMVEIAIEASDFTLTPFVTGSHFDEPQDYCIFNSSSLIWWLFRSLSASHLMIFWQKRVRIFRSLGIGARKRQRTNPKEFFLRRFKTLKSVPSVHDSKEVDDRDKNVIHVNFTQETHSPACCSLSR